MKRIFLGIILCNTIISSSQISACHDREAAFHREVSQPLLTLIQNAPNFEEQCDRAVNDTAHVAYQWNSDFSVKIFNPMIQLLCNANFCEDTYLKLRRTLRLVLWVCDDWTNMNSARGYGLGESARYGRKLLNGLLTLSQQDFLKVAPFVIELVTFLENASVGVFNASMPYLAKISDIFLPMINRNRWARGHSKDKQIADDFFEKFPSDVIDKLVGTVPMQQDEDTESSKELKELRKRLTVLAERDPLYQIHDSLRPLEKWELDEEEDED